MNSQLFEGDCLEILPQLDASSVDLVYLDPPFFTQKTHKLRTRDRRREFSFDDLWGSHTDYAAFLFDRLQAIKRVMSPTGSLFFHCDRNSYKKANEAALAMLAGLELATVQRNSGIDAILKDDINGLPIPVRVQRPSETIPEAANRLYQAAKTKNAETMFLVAIKRGGYFVFGDEIPPPVQIVEAPGLIIQQLVSRLKNGRHASEIYAADSVGE